MSDYSTGWTQEAQKSHGEALSTKVYVRYLDGENYWNWDAGRISISGTPDPGGTAPLMKQLYTDPYSVTTDRTRRFVIYEFGYVSYRLDTGDFDKSQNVCFSVYVHSATTDVSVDLFSLEIDTYPNNTDNILALWDRDAAGTGFTFDSLAGSWAADLSIHHGEEYIGSGWSRLYVSVEGGFTGDTNTLEYSFNIYPGGDGAGNNVDLYFCGPQISTVDYLPIDHVETYGAISGPNTFVELSDHNGTIGINPIARKRERKHGVVQGQKTQVVISDVDNTKMSKNLTGAWCAVQVGFPSIDEWQTMAQGVIQDVGMTTDLRATIEFDGAVMSVLNAEISRPMFFGEDAWIGNVEVVEKHKDSKTYTGVTPTIDQDHALSVNDETFQIRFFDDETFKIYNESNTPMYDVTVSGDTIDGTTYYTGTNAVWSSTNFTGTSENIFELNSAGWVESTDAYRVDDIFEVTSSSPRTIKQLSPIGMVRHLIEDVANVQAYDVMNGEYYTSYDSERDSGDEIYETAIDDLDYWTGFTEDKTVSELGGFWKRGTKVIQMIQDSLILEVASIFPTETGQIGLYVPLQLITGVTVQGLVGTVGGNVNIISANYNNSNEEYANVVNIEYLKFDELNIATSADTKIQTVDRTKRSQKLTEITLKSGWRVLDSVARVCISRSVVRFNEIRRIFGVNTTLELADIDITNSVTITDPFLNVSLEQAEVVEKSIDVGNAVVGLVMWNDPLGKGGFARIYDPIDFVGTKIDQDDEFIW